MGERWGRLVGGAAALLAGLALSSAARAQVGGEVTVSPNNSNAWSATGGETVGSGNGVVLGEVGWPGISVQYSHGLDDRSDLGFKASFLYSFEGTTNGLVGLNLAVPYKRNLYRGSTLSVSGHIDPGVTFYGNRGPETGNLFGVGGPVGLIAGFRIDDRLSVDLIGDVPVLVSFSNPAGVLFGPQIGAGAEYKLDPNLAVTFRSRFGPEFGVVNGGSGGQFAFQTLVGLAYNSR